MMSTNFDGIWEMSVHFKLMRNMHKPGAQMQGSHKDHMPKGSMPGHGMHK